MSFSPDYLIESLFSYSSEISIKLIKISLDFCTQDFSVSIKCMAFIIRIFPITVHWVTIEKKYTFSLKKNIRF